VTEKTYTVELTEAEIESLVHGQEFVKISLGRSHGDITRSSSSPEIRETYRLIDKLYTALLRAGWRVPTMTGRKDTRAKAQAADRIAQKWKSGDILTMSKGELVDYVAEALLEAGCDL
jgi:hypothetical protein